MKESCGLPIPGPPCPICGEIFFDPVQATDWYRVDQHLSSFHRVDEHLERLSKWVPHGFSRPTYQKSYKNNKVVTSKTDPRDGSMANTNENTRAG